MNRPDYPEMIHTYDGWGVIARGHGLTAEQQADAIRECDPAMLPKSNQVIDAQEQHFGFSTRVKWCGERYGSSCDQEGDWHGHWYALKANDDESTKFTIMHVKDVPAVKTEPLPVPLAAALNDPEGHALVQAIHDRKRGALAAIPDGAVEAAAKALDPHTMGSAGPVSENFKEATRAEARAALEAAAPYMQTPNGRQATG